MSRAEKFEHDTHLLRIALKPLPFLQLPQRIPVGKQKCVLIPEKFLFMELDDCLIGK